MDPGGGQKISRAETLLGCGTFSDHLVHTKPFGLLERFGGKQGTKHSHLPWYQSGKSDHPCGTVPDPHCGAVWLGPGCQWRPRAFILLVFRPGEMVFKSGPFSSFNPAQKHSALGRYPNRPPLPQKSLAEANAGADRGDRVKK